jgi:DNA-binding CsgD family transcriptional regulator
MLKKIFFCYSFIFLFYQNRLIAQPLVDSVFTAALNNSKYNNKLKSLELTYFACRSNGLFKDSIVSVGFLSKCITTAKQLKDIEFESIFNSHLGRLYLMSYNNAKLSRVYINNGLALANTNKAQGTAWFTLGFLHYSKFSVYKDSTLICFLKANEYLKNEKDAAVQLSLYSALADYYKMQLVVDKQLLYAKKSVSYLDIGTNLTLEDSIRAHKMLADVYYHLAKSNHSNNSYVDSALNVFRYILHLAKARSLNYNPFGIITATNNDLAALFYEFPNRFSRDSVLFYIEAACNIPKLNNQFKNEYAAIPLLFKGKVLLELNRFSEAKKCLDEAASLYDKISIDPYVGSEYYYTRSILAEKSGDYKLAFDYKQKQYDLKDSLYSLEKLETVQKTETQFKNLLQEQELIQEKKANAFRKKMNYVYLALAIIGLMGIYLMYKTNKLNKRNMLQKEQLLEEEKQQALLQAKVKEDEAIEAMMEKDIAEQERIIVEQEKLLSQQQRDSLQHVLMVNTLQVERKNDLIKNLQEKIKHISSTKEVQDKKMEKSIDQTVHKDEELDYIQDMLSNTNPKFFQLLLAKSDQALTNLDLKYCAYIKMGMSNREIAQVMSVEQKSVRMAKYRLKQKLSLNRDNDLDNFIINIENMSRLNS